MIIAVGCVRDAVIVVLDLTHCLLPEMLGSQPAVDEFWDSTAAIISDHDMVSR